MKRAKPSGLPVAVILAVAAGALVGTGAAFAQDEVVAQPDPGADYQAGLEHYQRQDYPAAIAALQRASAIEPRPEILFALAQALRLSGDCVRALSVFEAFLATDPPARQVQAANISMKLCAERVPPSQPPSPGTIPEPAMPVPPRPEAALDTSVPAPRAPPPADTLTYVLTLGGVAVVIAGGAVLFSGHALDARARGAPYGSYDQDRSAAETRVAAGAGAMVLGGALIVTGAVRHLWLQIDTDAHAANLGVRGHF